MLLTFTAGVAFPVADLPPEALAAIATGNEPVIQARAVSNSLR